MDYSYYLSKYEIDQDKLLSFGFTKQGNEYFYKVELSDKSLVARIKISEKEISLKVFDKEFNDEFLPFNIVDHVCKERIEAEELLQSIIKQCFTSIDMTRKVIQYLKEHFNTSPEQPWEEYPNYYTFKTQKSQKWYAVIMNIKKAQLKLESENQVDIINIKLDSIGTRNLIDNIQYFPAYHMNKKYWISIILDKNTDFEKLKSLIDESYGLVEK